MLSGITCCHGNVGCEGVQSLSQQRKIVGPFFVDWKPIKDQTLLVKGKYDFDLA